MGSIIHAYGTIEVEVGDDFGAGVLLIGKARVGRMRIGSTTTILNRSVSLSTW